MYIINIIRHSVACGPFTLWSMILRSYDLNEYIILNTLVKKLLNDHVEKISITDFYD